MNLLIRAGTPIVLRSWIRMLGTMSNALFISRKTQNVQIIDKLFMNFTKQDYQIINALSNLNSN